MEARVPWTHASARLAASAWESSACAASASLSAPPVPLPPPPLPPPSLSPLVAPGIALVWKCWAAAARCFAACCLHMGTLVCQRIHSQEREGSTSRHVSVDIATSALLLLLLLLLEQCVPFESSELFEGFRHLLLPRPRAVAITAPAPHIRVFHMSARTDVLARSWAHVRAQLAGERNMQN